jgi:hypothetical protein
MHSSQTFGNVTFDNLSDLIFKYQVSYVPLCIATGDISIPFDAQIICRFLDTDRKSKLLPDMQAIRFQLYL